jgi:hypothetical protein
VRLLGIADTASSFKRNIKSKEEVNTFLDQAKACLDDESLWEINKETWTGVRVNKTQAFLAEKNLHDDDVAEVLKELQVSNYSYTVDDRNTNFPNETFWIFGMTRSIIDSEVKLYIKLKIRKFEDEFLLVMSFHPEQPFGPDNELTFPYAKQI